LYRVPETFSLEEAAVTEPFSAVVQAVTELTPVPSGDTAVVSGPGPMGLLTLKLLVSNGVRTIVARLDLSLYFALVIRFPGGTGIVFADLPSGTIEQICLRRLEDPFEPGGIGLAGAALINLHTCGLRLER
jgi:hypothetical protein